MKKIETSLSTKLIHAGEPIPRIEQAVTLPIFQSSTFEFQGASNYHDVKYIRLNNTPNHYALHQKLAAIESAEDALVTTSGMAAISTSLLSLFSHGDHLLFQSCLYGGTYDLVTKELPKFGIRYDFVDGSSPETWESYLTPQTKGFFVESLSNPLLQILPLDEVVSFCKKHELLSLIDNTFTSPINFRPIEMGFDLVLHSASKYLNGHSDIVAGAVLGNKVLIKQILYTLNHLGGSLDPHACFLLQRGLKTLSLRVKQQNQSALRLASFLQNQNIVEKVYYPGLSSHLQHDLARKWFEGFGGVLSFELKGDVLQAEQFLHALTIPVIAPSLGGVETLVTRPATTSHAGMSPEDRLKAGIAEKLIRVSVGIESSEDLVNDFEQALEIVSTH